MKIIKKYLILILLISVTIAFSACSTTRLITKQNADGTVDELVYITIDKAETQKLGEDYYSIRTTAEDIARTTAIKLAVEYNASHVVNVNSHQLAVQLIDVVWYEEDSFVVGLRFLNSAVYKEFYGIDSSGEATLEKEKHFLYTKLYQTGSTVYALNQNLATQIYQQIYEKYPNLTKADNKLLYTYMADSRREHSDADYVTHTAGKYYHTWEIDKSNLKQQITIYYILLNRGVIILLCLGASLIVCCLLCLIVFIKNKNKQKQT